MEVTEFKKSEEEYAQNVQNPEVDNEIILETEEDVPNAVEEEIVVIADHDMDTDFRETETESVDGEHTTEIPQPTDEFLAVFSSIPTRESNLALIQSLCVYSWRQYYESSQQVVMEGNTRAWMACSIYLTMVGRKFSRLYTYPFSLSDIQKASGVSVLELFDKLERFMEITGASKRLKEHIQKIQGSLAVSAVVYKKLLPVFRNLFLNAAEVKGMCISSLDLLKLLWSMFVYVKKSLTTEDLLSSFHLLLCVVEVVYDEVRKQGLDELVNLEFSDRLIESECGVLEFLCKSFGGVVLDAKHFKAHWFASKRRVCLNISDASNLLQQYTQFVAIWAEAYEDIALKRGEIDERMFLPTTEEDFQRIFNEAYDGSAVELLRRGPDDSTFADVDLLLRMSTQQCLEKLTEYKKSSQHSSKTYILSSDNLYPSSPMTFTIQNPVKLAALIPDGWKLVGSELEIICAGMKDDPLTTIACNAENFAQRFADKVIEEEEVFGKDYDPSIISSLTKHQELVRDLFYVFMEHIIRGEQEKGAGREGEICVILRKEEFLSSVFCCALEMLLFAYNSARAFPWSIQMCDLPPICFNKVIELVVRSVPNLSREVVKHLNKKEEEVIEELAWMATSPLWRVLAERPGGVPSCDVAWKQPRQLAESYSPVKRRKRDDGTASPVSPTAGNMTMMLYFRKVYYLACIRMTDICERVRMNDLGRRMAWSLLEHILRKETSLMVNRHLDQNILCIIYVVAKYTKMTCTFMDVIAQYRHQPQARSQVYREVSVDASQVLVGGTPEDGNSRDSTSAMVGQPRLRSASTIPTNSVPGTPEPISSEKVDLIRYYNKVFLPRVEDFVKQMEDEENAERMVPMPKPQGFGLSPMKRALADRVHVQPMNILSNSGDRRFKYNINQSPRKDLMTINRMVSLGGNQPSSFYGASDAVSYRR